MIPMVDLSLQFEEIKDEIAQVTEKIYSSSRYILGPHVSELEENIAQHTGTRYAIGVASGTDALHLALVAAGIGKGDEVITTPFTFFATVEAIIYCGARPVFVDIEPDTFNMNAALIENVINERTKAILPVHIYGHPCNMDTIMAIAEKYSLVVVEDCAQAFGADINGRKVGCFGNAGCFSFYPSKNLGCYGDGGMIVTSEEKLASIARTLRNHGTASTYSHQRIGFNSRLDEIQAGILLVKLKKIEKYNDLRRKNAGLYKKYMGSKIICPVEKEGYRHVYHQYTIRCHSRDLMQETLKSEGVSSVIYYPIPMHLQKAVEFLEYKKGDFPEAEKASQEVLSLPMYPELKERDIEKICRIINEASC